MRLTLVLLLLVRVAAAEPVLEQLPTRMLDGAIELQLPAGMKKVPNDRDLDGRALPTWVITRADLTLGDGAIYVVARLTFMRPGDDLKRGIAAELALQDLVGVVRPAKFGEARGATVDPPSPHRGDASNLIHAAYIVGDNQQIATIGFYASGAVYDDLTPWIELARASTATLRHLGSWDHFLGASVKLAGFTLELQPALDWTVVESSNAVFAYQGGTLGKPAAVCGIDDESAKAPAVSSTEKVRFLEVSSTARSWMDQRIGRAEVVARKIRAWCRVRGGSSGDAMRALRKLLSGLTP